METCAHVEATMHQGLGMSVAHVIRKQKPSSTHPGRLQRLLVL